MSGFMVPGPTTYVPPRGFPTCVPAERKALADYTCKRYQTVKGLGATVDPYAAAPACFVAAMPVCATQVRPAFQAPPVAQLSTALMSSVRMPVSTQPVLNTSPQFIPPPPAPEPNNKALVVGGILAAALVVGGGYLVYKSRKKAAA